jgi:hypothetical protein
VTRSVSWLEVTQHIEDGFILLVEEGLGLVESTAIECLVNATWYHFEKLLGDVGNLGEIDSLNAKLLPSPLQAEGNTIDTNNSSDQIKYVRNCRSMSKGRGQLT